LVSFPWLLTPRPKADNGFISTYLAPTSTTNSQALTMAFAMAGPRSGNAEVRSPQVWRRQALMLGS
jgi:hypothetical protein